MTAVDMLGSGNELADGLGGSVDVVMGTIVHIANPGQEIRRIVMAGKCVLFASVYLLACACAANASTIIYSNIGAGFPGDTPARYGTGSTGPFDLGTTFTTTGGGILADLSTGLSYAGAAQPPAVTAGLYTDSSGKPGTLLEDWTFDLPPELPSTGVTTLTSVLNPSLTSGTPYWFVILQAPEPLRWDANDQNVLGGVWIGTDINDLTQIFESNAAVGIRLDSTTIPEPASGLLLTVGTLLLMTLGRFSRRL